jgi:hypothetical protein
MRGEVGRSRGQISGMRLTLHTAVGSMIAAAMLSPASAQRIDTSARIENGVAVFAALDKVTARISKLEVPLGETVKFGALKVTPRSCYTRQPTEPPKTSTYVEVQEIQLDGQEKKIFAGWMFAESPGLNAVEHPVYDVWLTDCAKPKATTTAAPAPAGRPAAGAAAKGGQPLPPPSGAPAAQPPTEGDLTRRRPPR